MGVVLTNKTSYNYAVESTFKTQPTSGWKALEPNTVGKFSADYTKVARSPITKDRLARKGATVNVTSGVEIETDVTRSAFRDFLESYMFATATGLQGTAVFAPTAVVDGGVSADSFTVAADGDLLENTLIYARGFTTTANNGVFTVTTGSTATSIKVPTATLTAEASPPSNAEVAVCGVVGAAGDFEVDASGNIISTTLDFTTLGLTVGQYVYLPAAASTYGFALAGNEGLARLDAIAAHTLTLSHKTNTFQADDGTDTGSGGTNKQVRIYFGQFVRNYDVDDASFLEQSIHFEQVAPNLGTGGATRYRYAAGNYANEMTINAPVTDKATFNFAFVGTLVGDPTATRATLGSGEPIDPNSTTLYSTATNISRLRVIETDETGVESDFTDVKMTIANAVTPSNVLGTLGAKYINYGMFSCMVDASVIFTNEDLLTAISANRTMSWDMFLKNDDGGVILEMPSVMIEGGDLKLDVNQEVKAAFKMTAFKDSTLGYALGVSYFPYLP